MKVSDETKKNRLLAVLFLVISYATLYGPILYYVIEGLVIAGTASKIVLSLMAVSAIIVGVICFIQKKHFRSPLWLIILGIFFAVKNILPLIITVACATILDELLFTPLYKLFKERARTNREIDKRI
jgi:hypothetical protein